MEHYQYSCACQTNNHSLLHQKEHNDENRAIKEIIDLLWDEEDDAGNDCLVIPLAHVFNL
jgi:hypothetical protein